MASFTGANFVIFHKIQERTQYGQSYIMQYVIVAYRSRCVKAISPFFIVRNQDSVLHPDVHPIKQHGIQKLVIAKRGTPIQATTQGIVSKVGENSLGGRVVVIIGPGGAGHYYAHLEDYADISPNDWVNAGDIIGYVGDSGNANGTPPHVHYGIYINGSAVNPYPLLQKPDS